MQHNRLKPKSIDTQILHELQDSGHQIKNGARKKIKN